MEKNSRRILITAVAGLLAVAVVLSALFMPQRGPGSSGGSGAPLSAMALAEPTYPEFPKQPVREEIADPKTYYDELNHYYEALTALRGEEGLDPDLTSALSTFAAESTAHVLSQTSGKNVIYSPLSLWSALAMLSRCAEGESRGQILDALGADSVEQLDAQVEQIWRKLYTDDGQSSLLFANSVWLNSSMEGSYVQDTVNTLAQKHYAGSYAVPMGTDDADAAVQGWVADQTRGLIRYNPKTAPETLAMLASTLYYKAGWHNKFHAEFNTDDIFTNADGSTVKSIFMHQTQNASCIRTEDYRAAWLPTRLGSMTFVLPEEGVTPEELLQREGFLNSLDSQKANSANVSRARVEWSVPVFDVDSRLNLMETLKAMGITHVTDPELADMSGITTLPAVVSNAQQMAHIIVNEEGVEAAAATIISVDLTAADDPETVCVMDLDRPFLFVLRYEDLPLFVGIVNQL